MWTFPLTLVQENGRRQKTLVCEKFDQLYTILEEKKRDMSQKVTAEQEEKLNYIRGLSRKYGDHLEESCKIVEMGIQTLEEPEMASFLQVRGYTLTTSLDVTENPSGFMFIFIPLPLSEHKASPQEVSSYFHHWFRIRPYSVTTLRFPHEQENQDI